MNISDPRFLIKMARFKKISIFLLFIFSMSYHFPAEGANDTNDEELRPYVEKFPQFFENRPDLKLSPTEQEWKTVLTDPDRQRRRLALGERNITPDNISAYISLGSTPLFKATAGGDLKQVEVLLNYEPKPNINAQTIGKITPLYNAIKNKKMDIAFFLIKNGADISLALENSKKGESNPQRQKVINILQEMKDALEDQKSLKKLGRDPALAYSAYLKILQKRYGSDGISQLLVSDGGIEKLRNPSGGKCTPQAVDVTKMRAMVKHLDDIINGTILDLEPQSRLDHLMKETKQELERL